MTKPTQTTTNKPLIQPKKQAWLGKALQLLLLIVLVALFEGWGVLGFLLFILGISLMRVWGGRDNILNLIRMTEVSIWKRPLDKEAWNKNELKNTKVKITFGKSKLWLDIIVWQGFIMVLSLLFLLLAAFKNSTNYLIASGFLLLVFIILGRWKK